MEINREMYRTLKSLDNCATNQIPSDSPLTYCLVNTMDSRFLHGGSSGNQMTPRSNMCRQYMADRCGEKWDGFCSYFHAEHQDQYVINPEWNRYMTLGDDMLDRAAQNRFCEFPACNEEKVLFNPLNPRSGYVKFRRNQQNSSMKCVPVCNKIDAKTIDDDPVMKRILLKPQNHLEFLQNVCNTTHRNGTDLTGTKLGAFCATIVPPNAGAQVMAQRPANNYSYL